MPSPPSWRQGLPSRPELALAVVVTAVMAFSLNQARYPLPSLLVVVPAGLSLARRRSHPMLPLGLNCVAFAVVFGTAPPPWGPQTLFFGPVLAVYSAAVSRSGRVLHVAGAFSLLALWVGFVAGPDSDALDFFPFVVWGAPFLAGRLVRRQTLQAREAGARAALLEVEAAEAASRERDRIARELHDVVGHAVSLMVVQAGAERLALPGGRTRQVLETIETTGREALVELRAMLGVLRATDDQGLVPQPDLSAVPALVEAVRDAGLAVSLSLTGAREVPAGVGLAGYRVVQEALTNAVRYGAGSAAVRLEAADEVLIEVRNPRGRAVASIGGGVGLVGMRERVELLGGTLEAGADGEDWVVTARIPVGRAA